MEDKIEQLTRLKKMLDEGSITEVEFNLLKKNIIGNSVNNGKVPLTKQSSSNKVVEDNKNLPPAENNNSNKKKILYFFIVLVFIAIVGIVYYCLTKDPSKESNSMTTNAYAGAIDTTKVITADTTRMDTNSNQLNGNTNVDEVKKNNIEKYITAQDNRNFAGFSIYYAPMIRRNWEMYNPTLTQIQNVTTHIWSVTSSSSQKIKGMETVNDSTVKVDVTNTYTTRKKSITKQIEYYIYFVFDTNNLIVETYGYVKGTEQKGISQDSAIQINNANANSDANTSQNSNSDQTNTADEVQKYTSYQVIKTSAADSQKSSLQFTEGINISINKDMSFTIESYDFLSAVFGDNIGLVNLANYDKGKFINPSLVNQSSADGISDNSYVGTLTMNTTKNVYSYTTKAIFIYSSDSKLMGINIGVKGDSYSYSIKF